MTDEENDEATIRHAMTRPVEPVLRAQFKTIRRLRALIKDAERTSGGGNECTWCNRTVRDRSGAPAPHGDDCPAFTPSGDVR